MLKVLLHFGLDLLRNKIIATYIAIICILGWGIFAIESHPEKVLLSLFQVAILIIPLVSMVFTTIYYYNSMEFLALLLTLPISRNATFTAFFTALAAAFLSAFFLGIVLPVVVIYPGNQAIILSIGGLLLTLSCIAISLLICIIAHDKTRGMGLNLLAWILLAFVFDALMLSLMYRFADYPIEKLILLISFFNPLVIMRTLVIMQTEAAALLGIAGAVFRDYFGSTTGVSIALGSLSLWIILPFSAALYIFNKKDM